MTRLALFQCNWPLQLHTTELARRLAAAGYAVDLFLSGCSGRYVDARELAGEGRVNVIEFRPGLRARIDDRLARLPGSRLYARHLTVLPASLVAGAVRRLAGAACKYYLGIEKQGLIWADAVAQQTGVPTIYYSLELYLEDHPAFADDPLFPRLRAAERAAHARAQATLVQDPLRGAELARANRIDRMDWHYFPVSVPGPVRHDGGNWFHRRFSLEPGRKVLLYLGTLGPGRASDQVAAVAGRLPRDYVMVLHGPGQTADLETLRRQADGERLCLSPELLPSGELGDLAASAHVGLALYPGAGVNDELTAFASEKVALYCLAGVPFVAFDNRSYRALFAEFACGVLIDTVEQLPAALAKIDTDYVRYSANCRAAFARYYDFAANFAQLRAYLDG